jgi:MFS family permease
VQLVNRSTSRPSRLEEAAISAAFAVNGVLFASWVSRLPAVRDHLHATEPQLGLALLGTAVGALIAMPTTARLGARFGTRRVLLTAMVLASVALQLAALAGSVAALALALTLFGLAVGVWDVSMNTIAHDIELRAAKPLMPGFHGAYSLGALVGAALGGLAAATGLVVRWHVLLAGVLAAAVAVTAFLALAEPQRVERAVVDHGGAPRRRVNRTLVVLGLITVCTTLGEGAAADWSGIFLHDVRGAAESTAAIGYAVFAMAMAIGRFSGSWVLSRISRVDALRASGALVFGGLFALLALPSAATGMAAMAVWGFGVALVFPAAMSAAAEHSPDPAQGIATVASIGYAGFLIGPPVIGFLAGHLGLGVALWVVAGLGIVLARLAREAGPGPYALPSSAAAEPVEDLSAAAACSLS